MSSIHNLPGINLFIHVYVYVEALCAQTREENFAFKSLSYMDFLIAYSPMRSLKVCGASTQALRVKNQLIRVIFHFFNIITQWGTSPFIDKLINGSFICLFIIDNYSLAPAAYKYLLTLPVDSHLYLCKKTASLRFIEEMLLLVLTLCIA